MGRKSSKKQQLLVKLVRSPAGNATSLFRSRRFPNSFFKLATLGLVAYGIYLLKKPDDDYMSRNVRDTNAFGSSNLAGNFGNFAQPQQQPIVQPLGGQPLVVQPSLDLNAGALNSGIASTEAPVESTTTTEAGPKGIDDFGPLGDKWPQCDALPKTYGNNVVFLKTHKTGSSTMSNIMLRYCDTHNLTVGLPFEGKWELGGYPAYIDKQLIDPQLDTYNILGHHFRFNIENLRGFMPADTKYITILRSPIDNVESVFGFFQDQEPFTYWMENIESVERLGLFYGDPMRFFNTNTNWFFRSRNHMFFDNGLNVLASDDAYIDKSIAELNDIYTFVLMTDFFDQSLILMKHLLCWDWEDVVYVKFKMRIASAKSNITPELAEQIKRWNYADVKLYDFFNRTFWERVEDFGVERMDAHMAEFEKRQKEAEKLCIDSYQPFKKKPWILGAKLVKNPSDHCKHLAWSETVYGEHLRDKMYDSIPGLTRPTDAEKETANQLFEQIASAALQKT